MERFKFKYLIVLFVFLIVCFVRGDNLLINNVYFQGELSGALQHQSDIHFTYGGNNFAGKLFLIDTIDNEQDIIFNGNTKHCRKQLRGFFWNDARGNRLWPIDDDTLNLFKSIDSTYNGLELTGALFGNCDGNITDIYGYLNHKWGGISYELIAGVKYNFSLNSFIFEFENNLNSTETLISGYWMDSAGGIGDINGTGIKICDQTRVGDLSSVCSNQTIAQTNDCGQTRTVNGTKQCSNGGGGGGSYLRKDICPDGDYSPSYYDRDCGKKPVDESDVDTGDNQHNISNKEDVNSKGCSVSNYDKKHYSTELLSAFEFAYENKITTQCPIGQADLGGKLIRKHMAKMISNYAMNVLGKKPDYTRKCVFDDVSAENSEMKHYMKLSCYLGLMGLKQDGTPDSIFNPNEVVSRAMFGTAFSRLLYGGRNNSKYGIWYKKHLEALKNDKIMLYINNPYQAELRGYVMIMMKRSVEFLNLINK